MTSEELEQAVQLHTIEIAEIRQTLAETAQQQQQQAQQMQEYAQQTREYAQQMQEYVQQNQQQFTHVWSVVNANAEQIANLTAGLFELRGLVADYLRGRSEQES
jgi:2-polyprenyl-6-methoxyphenol hydroxylase-like FAD-dependent oxidoreductase